MSASYRNDPAWAGQRPADSQGGLICKVNISSAPRVTATYSWTLTSRHIIPYMHLPHNILYHGGMFLNRANWPVVEQAKWRIRQSRDRRCSESTAQLRWPRRLKSQSRGLRV